ncbi:MAG: type IV pili methyl-accepting chemotaxis transducer N-terminal domain-containing protein [Lautropia sp.]
MPRPLAAKLGMIGSVLLLLVLAAIGVTLWVTWQLEGGAAAVNEAGRMRMQTWQLAQTLSAGDRQRLAAQLEGFDRSLVLLRKGDPVRPLVVPRDAASREALARVQRDWEVLSEQWARAPAGSGSTDVARQAEAFVASIDAFVDTIEQQLSRWTTLLNGAQIAVTALAIVAAVALMYAAQLLVFTPLSRLQAGLASVEAGDLSTRVEAATGDEFGAVAAGFNRMAVRLEDLYGSLERRVQEKTGHLETERARLGTLYETAAFVSQAGDLQALARGVIGQLRRAAGADAAAVRWSDEQNRRYLLLASEGLPESLIQAEQCVRTGECFCGQPRETAQTQVFMLRDLRGNIGRCTRAGFATVVGLPMRLHERMIGEIDLFYRQPVVLQDDDRAFYEALASHLAGGIEGLRADALRREAAVAEERGLLARELHDSIAQSLVFLKIQAGLLREEIGRDRADRVQSTLSELDTGIRESLADVRELLLNFRTRTNTEDIAPALRSTLTKFEHQTGLPTHLSIEDEGLPLPADVQVQVLHVVQEALSNVRKHARAHGVWVEVQQSPRWVVEVRDDGCGFAGDAASDDGTHVGLRIMRERADSIGASLEIGSVPGAGTSVTLTLPPTLAAAPEAASAPSSHA